jgi:hypothetical protein
VCVATLYILMIPFMLDYGDHVVNKLDLDFYL